MTSRHSIHYFATTRGSFLPDIDPREHCLMIHGLVDRPVTFTMEDLKRLPVRHPPSFHPSAQGIDRHGQRKPAKKRTA
jgi:hypothetical protein